MRNPWSSEKFTGDWSSTSTLWTEELKAEVGEDLANDGVFFMTVEDYTMLFSHTMFSFDTTGWYNASFLKLDDNSQAENPGVKSNCGPECTNHSLTLTSAVDQTVYLTAHTWDKRGIADSCESVTDKKHYLWLEGSGAAQFKHGGRSISPFQMTAGESVTVNTEWNFTDANVAKDWSVVAWGEMGDLTLTHDGGWTSDILPVIERVEGP